MTPAQQERMRVAFRKALAETFTWRGIRRALNEDMQVEIAWYCGAASGLSFAIVVLLLAFP
jgi:hypothetical protein